MKVFTSFVIDPFPSCILVRSTFGTALIAVSVEWSRCRAVFILFYLYTCSTDMTPRPLFALIRYGSFFEDTECFELVSFRIFLSILISSFRSFTGQCMIAASLMTRNALSWCRSGFFSAFLLVPSGHLLASV